MSANIVALSREDGRIKAISFSGIIGLSHRPARILEANPMNKIQYKTWVSALLSTLPHEDSQNIRNAVVSLTHDDELADPDVLHLGSSGQGDLYALKVKPDYYIMLQRPTGAIDQLEVVDLVKEGAIQALRQTATAHR
jgi:hypothetical protein